MGQQEAQYQAARLFPKTLGENAAKQGRDGNLENKSDQDLLLMFIFLCVPIIFSPRLPLLQLTQPVHPIAKYSNSKAATF